MPKQKPNEQVQQIPLSEIRPFKNHPFKVTDDELMQQTIDSIMQVGVLNPAIIRPAPEGGYEMVATSLDRQAFTTSAEFIPLVSHPLSIHCKENPEWHSQAHCPVGSAS